jgi:hypothetical protein
VGVCFVVDLMCFSCRLRGISGVCRVSVCFCIFVVPLGVCGVVVNCARLCANLFCRDLAVFH